eukprot:969051-Prymnesium_polylepis.1
MRTRWRASDGLPTADGARGCPPSAERHGATRRDDGALRPPRRWPRGAQRWLARRDGGPAAARPGAPAAGRV